MHSLKSFVLYLVGFLVLCNSGFSETFRGREISFDHDVGLYTEAMFAEDFGNVAGYSPGEMSRHQITEDGTLDVTLLAHELTSAGGVTASVTLEPCSEYVLQYRIMFPEDFEWAAGGKIPGLAGGKAYTGGRSTEDGDGWSFRVMWHRYKTANGGKPYLCPYVYHYDMPGKYGDGLHSIYTLEKGVWYTVELHAKMNTAGDHDGSICMNVDGHTVYESDQFRWAVKAPGLTIDKLLWNVFRGGSQDHYRASRTCHILFDDFKIEGH